MLTSALRPPLARLPFIMLMTITPLLLLTGAPIAVDLVDRLAILVADRRFPQAWVRRTLALYGHIKLCPHEGVCTAVYFCSHPSISLGELRR
jgi:hypothetical protein